MWLRIAASLLLLAIAARGGVPREQRVVGGVDTTIEKYPFIVQIERLGEATQIWSLSCGASILTSSRLLSAAHCLEQSDFEPSNRRIRAGTAIRGEGGTIATVAARINHPGYVGNTTVNIDHDIAIIYLVSELLYSTTIQPATIISYKSNFPPDDGPVVTVGWGRTVYQGDLANVLQEVTNYVVNQQECFRRYSDESPVDPTTFNTTVTENMICMGVLGVGGQAACNGDSGGPVLYYGVVIGVVSWSYQCADAYWPDVHARVSQYTNWIVENV